MEKEKVKELIKENWILEIIFITLALIFFKLAEDVFEKEIFGFDGMIYNFLVNHRNIQLNFIFEAITYLGSAYVIVPVLILSMIFIKGKENKITIPINTTIALVLNQIMKNIFERPRPDNMRLMDASGYSFPSGHAMVSTAFYGYLIYIAYKNIKNVKLRNCICIALSIMIFAIDISRVYIGVHYASDVIGGTTFSIAYLIIFINTIKLINYRKQEKNNE